MEVNIELRLGRWPEKRERLGGDSEIGLGRHASTAGSPAGYGSSRNKPVATDRAAY